MKTELEELKVELAKVEAFSWINITTIALGVAYTNPSGVRALTNAVKELVKAYAETEEKLKELEEKDYAEE